MTAEAIPVAPPPTGWTVADLDTLLDSELIYELVEVLMVAEVVSPSSRTDDRFRKPAQYAQAGIPVYLRVELTPPHVVAYALGPDGVYVETARAEPGERLVLTRPFPLTLDPAALLR